MIKILLITLITLTLLGCFGSKKTIRHDLPIPLTPLAKNQIKTNIIWSNDIDKSETPLTQGLQIASNSKMIFLASNSNLYAFNKNGELVWEKTLTSFYKTQKLINKKEGFTNFLFSENVSHKEGEYDIIITGGPSAIDTLLVVGGSLGEVLFINPNNGKIIKQTSVGSSVLSPPLIDEDSSQVLIKTIDSKVISLNIKNLNLNWQYTQSNTPLSIKGIAPIIKKDNLFITGFDNARLVFLDEDGIAINEQRITTPKGRTSLERIVDIDSAVIVKDDNIFVVSYQGNALSINTETNKTNWIIPFSSLLGGGIIKNTLYLIDDKSIIHGISALSGNKLWQQKQLKYRIKTFAVQLNDLIIVGDVKGYLHFINPELGNIIGRAKITDNKIKKLKVIDNKLFVLDSDNELFAVQINK